MPRKSAAASAFPSVHAGVIPRPPAGLSPAAAAIFRELVAAAPRGHFRASDVPVIEVYATAVAQTRQAERELAQGGPVTAGGKTSPWLRVRNDAAKVIASLSMRLRLCPQARETSRTVGRHVNGPAPNIYARLGWDEEEEKHG
jgi:phage terminase small subunit